MLATRDSNPHEFAHEGQVRQKSHLQPAVVEPAAVGQQRSRTYTSQPEIAYFDGASTWTFPRVHQRWRKIWRKLLMRTVDLLAPVMWSRAVQSVRQPEGLVTPQWTSRAVFDLCSNDATEEM
jgi:hypothetical protein